MADLIARQVQQAQKPLDLHFDIAPIQINDQMMVRIAIQDNFGMCVQFIWSQDLMRNFSKAIKAAVDAAEVAVIKPPSGPSLIAP